MKTTQIPASELRRYHTIVLPDGTKYDVTNVRTKDDGNIRIGYRLKISGLHPVRNWTTFLPDAKITVAELY